MTTDPTMTTTLRPVTGPDGDNPVSDAQIRELRAVMPDVAATALGEAESGSPDEDGERRDPDENEIDEAIARCAAAWNARQGGA